MSPKSQKPQKSQKNLRISVGPRWSSFTYERDGMEMLGTVQRGMQIGALVRLADGSYAQVNGDVIEVLNKSKVEFVLGPTARRELNPTYSIPTQAPSTAVVVIKKRRRIVPPPGQA